MKAGLSARPRAYHASASELDQRDGRTQARDPEQKHPPHNPTLERAEPALDDAQARKHAAFERREPVSSSARSSAVRCSSFASKRAKFSSFSSRSSVR